MTWSETTLEAQQRVATNDPAMSLWLESPDPSQGKWVCGLGAQTFRVALGNGARRRFVSRRQHLFSVVVSTSHGYIE